MNRDLAIVIPVYNEQDCIGTVLSEWFDVLGKLGIKYQIIALNDGSKDGTAKVLDDIKNPNLRAIHKANSGHGPTILTGYKMAVAEADWVFQCDSDGEMPPANFPLFWEKRNEYDALFGLRFNRLQTGSRAFISFISRTVIHSLYGSKVRDVNTPYRLMRGNILAEIITKIPEDTFAPNLIISGAFSKRGCRIFQSQVPHEPRKTGSVSIVKWRLVKAAFRSFIQTLKYRQ